MGKTTIRTDELLKWDGYKNGNVDKVLPVIYPHAKDVAKRSTDWYWSSIGIKRLASTWARYLTFPLLTVGMAAPIFAGIVIDTAKRPAVTQLGICALIFGSLLQVGDRVFGWSGGWLRHVTTVTAMETSIPNFELGWAAYNLNKSGNLQQADIMPLFGEQAAFLKKLTRLQSEEADKWMAEFSSSMALSNDLIISKREAGAKAEEAVKAARAAQQAAANAGAGNLPKGQAA